MRVEQISVLLRNEPGVLSRILEALSNGNINILGLTINETAAFGELRIVVSDTQRAHEILNKIDVSHNVVKIIMVNLPDKPGELLKIAKLLSENEINIDYIYTLSAGKNSAYVAIKSWDMPATEEILIEHKIKIVTLKEINH